MMIPPVCVHLLIGEEKLLAASLTQASKVQDVKASSSAFLGITPNCATSPGNKGQAATVEQLQSPDAAAVILTQLDAEASNVSGSHRTKAPLLAGPP
jgi:hypothetical protein